ncbi:MAG: single-stranded DNA-binding protein [Candidatus Marinimicrobia bacterium]|jgi:single-strand DNA-binding protein|nr:single-stranded DNA-binding protein [Candidatus Neomarinimicrobiota bacterium]|tara:strand:+ start:4758 stop:5177 length:420 start_codon:yes stop_codon:yes gene_type:complete
MQRNSINKVILVGHTGNKPEGRYTPSGTSTASFSLATNESWIDSDKGKQERTEWHNIVAWGKLADFATEYIQKGQLVYVEGRLQTRSWKDKEGNSRKTTEIVCTGITPLEWKSAKTNASTEDKNVDAVSEPKEEDDLPF